MRADPAAGRRAWRGLALACALLAPPAAAGDARAWVVATYAYPGRDRAVAIAPLAQYLSSRADRRVELRLFDSPSALVAAMRDGAADIAVPNLHGFLQARRDPARIVPLPVPDVPAAQADRYRAVVVVREGVGSVEALRREAPRLALAMVGPDSASGGLVPARGLRAMGVDPDRFASVVYAGSHAAALQAVVAGDADVAALAADVFDRAEAQGLHALWRSDPIPPGPLLCRVADDLPCDEIAAWLLDAHVHDARVMAALRAGWPEFADADRFRAADLAALQDLAGERADASGGD
jgi:phosphonate transport system substrate-binding protein